MSPALSSAHQLSAWQGLSQEVHRALRSSARILPEPQSRGLTCGWGQDRPGTACWKSVAGLPLGDDSFNFPSFRLLQAGITSGSPGTPYSLLPLLTALPLSWDNCPAAVSLQAKEWLGSPGLVAEGTVPAFARARNSHCPVCFMLFRDCLSLRASTPPCLLVHLLCF